MFLATSPSPHARTNLATTTQYTQYVIELAATLPVTSFRRARAQQTETSELKSALRSRSADDRMSDLVQIYVERDIADELGLGQLVSEFALKLRKLLL